MSVLRPQPSAAAAAAIGAAPRMLIGARWRDGGSTRLIGVENPSRAQMISEFPAASHQDLDDAVLAARLSLETGWGRVPPRERAAIMHRFADWLEARADTIGEVMAMDCGTPLTAATPVVRKLGAELFRYYAGWATKIAGDAFTTTVGVRDLDFLVATLREPAGVVGAIVPWNAPVGMMAMKAAPALAAGCTMVLKTAELAPMAGQFFAQGLLEAGAPPGTFNLLHGFGDDTGAAMAAHAGIDKLAFTGSTRAGRAIAAASAASNLKRVTLELGGKSPVVIMADADLAAAIPAAAMACFFVSGQACMAGTRLFVHARVHDEVVAGVARIGEALTLGDSLDIGTELGPVISAAHKARIEAMIDAGVAGGARLHRADAPVPEPGHFVRPAVFTGVRRDMRIAQEEIFGPVLAVFQFDDEAELIRDINSTVYGLSGSIWTRDIDRALRLARHMDSGQVAINHHAAMSPETPFGGNRQSGWGRELGREGLEPYLKTKAISIRLAHDL